MKKNLLTHCYINDIENPSRSTSFNLSILQQYISSFDGKKVVCVSIDEPGLFSIDQIICKFPVLREFNEILSIKNDSENRESSSFMDLLESVKEIDDSMTFYCHTKGSTHSLDNCLKNWILAMYFFSLEKEYLENIEYQFLHSCSVTSGILKKDCGWHIPGLSGDWHYSGAFFWLHNEKFFKQEWENFSKGRMSLESYLGQRITTDKAFCTFVTRNYNFHIDDHLWNEEISKDKIDPSVVERYRNLFNRLF